MEQVDLVAPGTFSFQPAGQDLHNLIVRTFGPAAFGPGFDGSSDTGNFIDVWVWGGANAP